jgi:hypothetical protein
VTPLRIEVHADGILREVPPEKIVEGDDLAVGGLAAGMTSGKPSVVITATLPDGRRVLLQTSLALYLTSADVLKAAHGDPR